MARLDTGADAGLRLIILYKTIKAVAGAVGALVLFLLVNRGVDALQHLATQLSHQMASPGAKWLAHFLETYATPKRLRWTALVLALDSVVTSAEAYMLHRRWRWGEWLVVVATGTFVPWEVYEVVVHLKPVRIGVLAINLAVVGYLSWRLTRRREVSENSDASSDTTSLTRAASRQDLQA